MAEFISLPVYGLVQELKTKASIFGSLTPCYVVKSPTYDNQEIHITKDIVDSSASFLEKYSTVEKLNKHQLAEKLVYSNGTVFKLEFEKKDSTTRTLIGFLSSTDTLLGYSTVVDLEEWVETNDVNKSKRTVYHSKLLAIIIGNVKYELKR
jgi:hypothetical protein